MASIVRVRDAITTLTQNHEEMKSLCKKKSKELEQCKADTMKSESKLAEIHKRMIDKEYSLLLKQQEIKNNIEKIAEFDHTSAECQRMNDVSSQKIVTQDSSIEQLQLQLENANSQVATASTTYSKTLERLRDARNAFERLEKQGEVKENSLIELEKEKNVLTYKLGKLTNQVDENTKRQRALEETITLLTSKLDAFIQKTREDEDTVEELSVQLTVLEDESADYIEKIRTLQDQLSTVKITMEDN